MEPDSVNRLQEEADKLKHEVLEELSGKPPEKIAYLFNDTAFFFEEEALAEWRRQERYDDLIEYIHYQFGEFGGEVFWQQVLLDLRLKKDEERAHKLLDGLYPLRAERFWIALENYKKYPENHFSLTNLAKVKGEVMSLLYEHAFVLENKAKEDQNPKLIELVRYRINEIHSETKIT